MSRHARALDVFVGSAKAQRPGTTIGTDRVPIDPDSDHTAWLKDSNGVGVCRAADVMVYGDKAAGDKLAANLAAKIGRHPAMGSGAYVIWYQRIWSYDRRSEGWRAMSDRGSITANHKDHVHLSLTRNQGGYDHTGSWGALFSGSGTGSTAPTPANPVGVSGSNAPLGSSIDPLAPNGAGDTRAMTVGLNGAAGSPGGYGANNVGLGVPGIDLEDVREGVLKLVIVGGALMLGSVLIALGAARASKPTRDAVQGASLDVKNDLAMALPQTRAAAVATSTTKGS